MLQQRIDKLRKTLQQKNLDGFLISNFYNTLYLTGFKTLTNDEREAWGLVTKNNVYLFTDLRYVKSQNSKGKSISKKLKVITPEKSLIVHLKEIITEEKIKRLGFEGDDLKVNELQKIKEKLVNVELVSLEKLIIKIREIKDEKEINKIRTACQIADQCLKEIVKTIKIGSSEKEVAFKIEFWLKEKGYDLSFYPIIAIDKNSAIPHYSTKDGSDKVKKNSIILIDFGAKFQDYCSDITRMVLVGKPTDEMINTYNKLLDAQTKTLQYLASSNRRGCTGKQIDQYCREKLTYPHSTGHGVGLEVHEYPKISFTSIDVLLPNQVVTVEPGVYIEGKWGMRIEDIVLIKENKQIEVLTQFSKQLLII